VCQVVFGNPTESLSERRETEDRLKWREDATNGAVDLPHDSPPCDVYPVKSRPDEGNGN